VLRWEDRDQFTDIDDMADEIEAIARPLVEELNKDIVRQKSENGRYFFKHSKVWEIPFVVDWLERLQEKLGKDSLKIMDFGCCMSPLPQYLACRGHTVWGIDDDSWGHIKNNHVADYYPDVLYCVKDVKDVEEGDFDAIVSLSVFEHIYPDSLRIAMMKRLASMLSQGGAQMHIVDFYFPHRLGRERERVSFYSVGMHMEWDVGDPKMCPGSSVFSFEDAREHIRFVREDAMETRIAIGDDI